MKVTYNNWMDNTFVHYLAYYLPLILAAGGGLTYFNKLNADIKTAQKEIKDLKDDLHRLEDNWRDELHHMRKEMNNSFGYQRQSLDKMYEILNNQRC